MKIPGMAIIWIMGMVTINMLSAEPSGQAVTSPQTSDFTSVIKTSAGLGRLVVQNKGQVLVEVISASPGGIVPRLQDAYLKGDQLALVLDYDLYFCYQIYQIKAGVPTLEQKVYFNPMGTVMRERLILVEMGDLTHVTLTMTAGVTGESIFRPKKIVQRDDVKEVFEFLGNGDVLKNGLPYKFNNGSESN